MMRLAIWRTAAVAVVAVLAVAACGSQRAAPPAATHTTLRLPLLTARAAFAELAAQPPAAAPSRAAS